MPVGCLMMRRNLNTTLRGRVRANPMADYDALPPSLRRWLAAADLPWSPRSVRKIWTRALVQSGGDPAAALAVVDRSARKTLARDAVRIWGRAHPSCALVTAPDHPPVATDNRNGPAQAES